jgi:hypothetical protein
MKLVDVKRTKADKKEEQESYEVADSSEDYPWGLSIRLDNSTIQKLGLGDLDADETVRVYAEAFVSEDSANKKNGKTVRSMTLQITRLAVAQSEKDEDKADALYGSKGN